MPHSLADLLVQVVFSTKGRALGSELKPWALACWARTLTGAALSGSRAHALAIPARAA